MSDPSESQDAKPRERSPSTDAEWAAIAASLSGPKPDAFEQQPAAARPADARSGSRGGFASALALLLAVIATTVAGFLWWQYRQFYVSLDQTDATAALALERVRADLRALEDNVEELGDDLASSRQLTAALTERVDQLPGRFVDLEQRLDAVQGGSFDARGDWIKSEAEYYLTVANTELVLAGHWENAITALELADARLAELGDPSFSEVREAIAGELLALRSVRLPDVEGLVFSLGRLTSRIDELPLRADLPTNFADEKAVEDAEPGLSRLWLSLKSALLGLVRIERREQPVAEAMSAAERLLARRQLALELELARIAALRAQPEAFQSSLKSAQDLLQRDFAADSAEVEGARALLEGMLELSLTPERPDISRSLNLLRTLQIGSD